jgi:uncharacterized protein
MGRPWTAAAGGLVVDVRLTPKGGRDALDGIATLANRRAVLKARVRAAPHENAANAALVRLIAKAARLPPRWNRRPTAPAMTKAPHDRPDH